MKTAFQFTYYFAKHKCFVWGIMLGYVCRGLIFEMVYGHPCLSFRNMNRLRWPEKGILFFVFIITTHLLSLRDIVALSSVSCVLCKCIMDLKSLGHHFRNVMHVYYYHWSIPLPSTWTICTKQKPRKCIRVVFFFYLLDNPVTGYDFNASTRKCQNWKNIPKLKLFILLYLCKDRTVI